MPRLVVVQLPHRLNGVNLRLVIKEFVTRCAGAIPDEVCIDFAQLGFIEPAGVTFLSNFILWLRNKGAATILTGFDATKDAVRFLDDALFFEQHHGSKLNPSANPRRTTMPLVDVLHERSHAFLRGKFVPWLARASSVSRPSLGPFQVCISEIFNNIQDHSTLEIGSFFAQHFPNLNRVSIAVADFGRGIPALVRQVHPNLSDNEAILKAAEVGFTTGSTPRNRGDGLDYLMQTAVASNGGTVTVFSLNGAVKFFRHGTSVRALPVRTSGFCPGTTFDISLRTDTIEHLGEEPEEFSW